MFGLDDYIAARNGLIARTSSPSTGPGSRSSRYRRRPSSSHTGRSSPTTTSKITTRRPSSASRARPSHVGAERHPDCRWIDRIAQSAVSNSSLFKLHIFDKEDRRVYHFCPGRTDSTRVTIPDAVRQRLEQYIRWYHELLCSRGATA